MIGDVSRTRATLTALTLVPALLVAGCSDDDPKPKFEPPPSSEAPTSASPTTGPTAPTMPAAAIGADAAAAEAFVKFYWDTVNYAQVSGDLDPLRQLADPTCVACEAGVKYLEGVFEADGRVIGGVATLKIQKSTLVDGDGRMESVVNFVLTTTPQRVDYGGARKDETFAGGHRTVNALLQRSGGSWLMSSWGVQK
jgi:hypothetical protein